jgi:glutathione S-transferase
MSELTLYADTSWQSPWVFHVMVALDELAVRYQLVPLKLPIASELRGELRANAVLGKVPCLVHGEFWLTESSAISEYLAETFSPPAHLRLYPADVHERARARQVLSWLRTSLGGLREDRPTSSVFQRPVATPLSDKGAQDAGELIRVADQLLAGDRTTLFAEWSMADADLALALMRLVANGDELVPPRLVDYAIAQWQRTSIRKYLANIPTTH